MSCISGTTSRRWRGASKNPLRKSHDPCGHPLPLQRCGGRAGGCRAGHVDCVAPQVPGDHVGPSALGPVRPK
eukprot:14395804-Alexandrium_andersonii.AAC.1